MRRTIDICLIVSVVAVFATGAKAQPTTTPAPDTEVKCSACHSCPKPTPQSLCLRGCTRGTAAAIAKELSSTRVPDVVILNELEDLYLPVPFDHRGHAGMAEMTKGCAVCHHFTPEGAPYPACKTCHERSPVREDMRKPSLKAAYHRQCMACHREWSHETACEICHPPKAGRGRESGMVAVPTKDDIVGRMHPPIPEPQQRRYDTKYKYVPGTVVLFRHEEHIHRFGFSCAECHSEDSCSRCHEEGKSQADLPKTLEDHHNPCATCHNVKSPEKCSHCHRPKDAPEVPPFDHARTGWPLSRHHASIGCRVCHQQVPFQKRERSCQTCHSDWTPGTFDHTVTGQTLDENHAQVDCESCHADRTFDIAPTCDECHDEEDGIRFPTKRPGPFTDLSD